MKATARSRRPKRGLISILAVLAAMGLGAGGGNKYTIVPIQGPASPDTEPYGITNNGVVTGFFADANFSYHGFVADGQGGFAPVNVPVPGAFNTNLYQGNQSGLVAGVYGDSNGLFHSAIFDRKAGSWTFLPDPDPTSVSSAAGAINDRGQVFGNWTPNADFSNNQGWVYQRGVYTFFDVPGADPSVGTLVFSANDRGDVVGFSVDGNGFAHGFIRHGNTGKIDTIDVPGAVSTQVFGINNAGVIVGRYRDTHGVRHGFILKNGHYTTFDVPGASNTFLTAVNDRGDLVGYTFESLNGPFTGFAAYKNDH